MVMRQGESEQSGRFLVQAAVGCYAARRCERDTLRGIQAASHRMSGAIRTAPDGYRSEIARDFPSVVPYPLRSRRLSIPLCVGPAPWPER